PCASELVDARTSPFESTSTSVSEDAHRAAKRPATPLPTTRRPTSGTEDVPGSPLMVVFASQAITSMAQSTTADLPSHIALAEVRDVYEAVLGYDVSATNLKRVLLRRGAIEPTGERRSHGPGGGRPAAAFRFRTRRLEVTDPFAVLRPPTSGER